MKSLGKRTGRLATWCVAVILGWQVGRPAGADPVTWRTGASLQRALAQPVSITWSGISLRRALTRLAQVQRVAILLDRRLDPSQKIEFSVQDTPLEDSLQRLAAQIHAAPALVGPVFYLSPRGTSANLSDVAARRREEADRLPSPVARRFTAKRPWHWPMLAVPRTLLEQLAGEAGTTIAGLDQIPHDLWPETDLPALAWTDRLTLVLAGFDRTFEFRDGGRTVRIIPFPAQTSILRSYPATLSQVKLQSVMESFPHARIDASSQHIVLEGTPDEHRRLEKLLRNQSTKRQRKGRTGATLYTLKVDHQPVGAILKTLQQKAGLQVDIAPAAAPLLNRRVTFDVREVTLDQLLKAALEPCGLEHRRTGQAIQVRPR